jgi:hypothetical protein
MISEVKVQMLLKLINSGRITIDDIKDEEYKTEVQSRLNNA